MSEANKTPLPTVGLILLGTCTTQFLLSFSFNMTSALTPELTSMWDFSIFLIGLMYMFVALPGIAWMYAANKLVPRIGIVRVYLLVTSVVAIGLFVSFGAAISTINEWRKFFLLGGQLITSASVAVAVCIDAIQIETFRNPSRTLPFSLIGSAQIISDQLGWFAAYLSMPLLMDISLSVAVASVAPVAITMVLSVLGTQYFFDDVRKSGSIQNKFITGSTVSKTPMYTIYALAGTGVAMGALDVFRRFMSPIWMAAFNIPPELVDQQIAWFIIPGIFFSILAGLMGWSIIAMLVSLIISFLSFTGTAAFVVIGSGTIFGNPTTGGFAKEAAMCFVAGNALFSVLTTAITPLAVTPEDTLKVCMAIEIMRMLSQTVFSLLFGILMEIGWGHLNILIIMGVIIAGSSAAAFYTLMYLVPKKTKKDDDSPLNMTVLQTV